MKGVTIFLLVALSYSSYANEKMFVRNHKTNGRVTYMQKKLAGADVDGGTPLTADVKRHAKEFSAPGDDIVQLVDAKIGGPGDSTDNALPMNPSSQEFWKTRVTDVVHKYLKEHKTEELLMAVIPYYDNANTKRPIAFSCYVVKLAKSNAAVVKAYIPNPPKSVSESTSSYVYSTGNLFEVARKNETFSIVGVGFDKSPIERVEMVMKRVKLSDLTTGTDLDSFSKTHVKSLAGPEPYVPGLLLSQKIGGKGDDPYNVVPMVPKTADEFKTRVEAPILDFFKDPANKDAATMIIVVVQYADYATTRPVGFTVLNDQLPYYSMYIPNL
ncbi:hypothetical protein GE061_010572 [Apolygus lucorum]|uniref:Uncharacterized protein n=1 Tax=Apolygus lucorum TaxID=248454 RepID=A0A6A4JTL4_APOLU|nr:hypothetical protein GE061_010572 [Apolygus lucorum]